MKKIIEILKTERVTTIVSEAVKKSIEIDIPQTAKYYHWYDDSRFFGRGDVIFAIIPKFTHTMLLVEVERGEQKYNDFRPESDCRTWIDESGTVRHTALEIMSGKSSDFKEITKGEFDEKRIVLLDVYKEYEESGVFISSKRK